MEVPEDIFQRANTFHRPVRMFGNFPTAMSEEKYEEKLQALWKDMNKCRYLRLADDKIDLSGVNTLVKDQMKLFRSIKQQKLNFYQ